MSHDFIETTIHDFKTHLSEYVRLIEENPDAAFIVNRYNKPVGIFIAYHGGQNQDQRD